MKYLILPHMTSVFLFSPSLDFFNLTLRVFAKIFTAQIACRRLLLVCGSLGGLKTTIKLKDQCVKRLVSIKNMNMSDIGFLTIKKMLLLSVIS